MRQVVSGKSNTVTRQSFVLPILSHPSVCPKTTTKMRIPSHVSKTVVETYLSTISARNFDALPDFFTVDATWWIAGNPERVPKAGTKPALEQIPLLPNLLTRFDEYSYNILNIVAEGDHVMVDAQAVGKGPLDLVYVNNITSAYVVNSERKINSVREWPVHSEIEWLLEWFAQHPNTTQTS